MEQAAKTVGILNRLNSCITLRQIDVGFGIVMFLLIRSMNRLQDQLKDDQGADDHAPEEPDNKKCVYCRSTIPFRAVRCPQCTSSLPSATDAVEVATSAD